jgi:hypothetical protein
MKKVFLYSSVLALTLTACSNDEILSSAADSGKAVGFGTLLSPSTRGAVFIKDGAYGLQTSGYGFSVAAYNQGTALTWTDYLSGLSGTLPDAPDFMNNTKVTWNSTKWDYTPIKYWPGKVDGTNYGRVTFFALGGLASGSLTIAYTGTGKKPEYTHTVPAAATDQKDLVADVLFDECWSNDKKVKFQFNHVLSKIGFEAKLATEYSGATVTVTNLQVNYATDKVKNSGTYAFNTNGTNAEGAEGSWTPSTSYLSGNSGELVTSPGVTLNNTSGDVATAKQLNEDSKFLMLIPQNIAAADLTVNLTYTITTGSPEETVVYPVTYQIPAITYLLGKQYTYSFTLTLNPVVFDTTLDVKVWEDGTSPGAISL